MAYNNILNLGVFSCSEMANVQNLTIVGIPEISTIDEKFFAKFSKLAFLSISMSNIKRVEKTAFVKFNNTLLRLSLVDCKLVQFPTAAVLPLKILQSLSLRDNEIAAVTNESARALDKNLEIKLLSLNSLY